MFDRTVLTSVSSGFDGKETEFQPAKSSTTKSVRSDLVNLVVVVRVLPAASLAFTTYVCDALVKAVAGWKKKVLLSAEAITLEVTSTVSRVADVIVTVDTSEPAL